MHTKCLQHGCLHQSGAGVALMVTVGQTLLSIRSSTHLQVRQPSRGLVSSGAAGQAPPGHDAEYLNVERAKLASDHAGIQPHSMNYLLPSCITLFLSVHL